MDFAPDSPLLYNIKDQDLATTGMKFKFRKEATLTIYYITMRYLAWDSASYGITMTSSPSDYCLKAYNTDQYSLPTEFTTAASLGSTRTTTINEA